jgi:hypothetical protein
MNIDPELAAKVLLADVRNIVKKVSDGGILSATERALLQTFALPDNPAKAKRAMALALKYSNGGRLSATELSEIREVHPDFAPDAVPIDGGEPAVVPPAAGSPALTLTAEPSPSAGDKEVSAADLARWSELYGPAHRQLRRWIERGIERGDPCPLDDAMKMPAWIDKHLEKIRSNVREKVAAAAEAARAAAPAPSDLPPASSSEPASEAPAPGAGKADLKPMLESIDLTKVGGVEGEMVAFQRTVCAAVKQQLEAAYAAGDDLRIGKLHHRLDKAGEQLRKYEDQAEKRATRRGELLDKAEVFNEIMEALNVFARLREHRQTRVRSELGDLPVDLLERIAVILEAVGKREEDALRNLSTLKTPADVSLSLAA